MAVPLVIDTDGGVDDACALWFAATDPRVDLVAVTVVWGNVSLEVATTAVRRVLHAAGRPDVPVAAGRATPVAGAPHLRAADFIHGLDGLGNAYLDADPPPGPPCQEPAVDLLARLLTERPGELMICTIGPLSNLAELVTRYPDLAGHVADLVVMGGSARRGGNALPVGEANIACDPTGAQQVVEAAWPSPPLMVGLDVTHQATLSPAEFDLLAEHRTPAAAFLDAPLRFYRQFASTRTAPDCPCHDLLAVMAVVEPGLLTEVPVLPVAVDCAGGPAWGATVVDFRETHFEHLEGSRQHTPSGFAPWRISLQADTDAFRAEVRALFGG